MELPDRPARVVMALFAFLPIAETFAMLAFLAAHPEPQHNVPTAEYRVANVPYSDNFNYVMASGGTLVA